MNGRLSADALRYDAIPDSLFDGNILEIGSRDGKAQIESRHSDRFLKASEEGRYLGVDVLDSSCSDLKMLKADFRDLETANRTYDTILMLEVLEHLSVREWPAIFAKIRSLLSPNGRIFITVPYNESINTLAGYLPVYEMEIAGGHVVFHITPNIMRLFLPHAKFEVVSRRYPFKTDNESWWWALGRFFKRIVTRSPLTWTWLKHDLRALVVLSS